MTNTSTSPITPSSTHSNCEVHAFANAYTGAITCKIVRASDQKVMEVRTDFKSIDEAVIWGEGLAR